MQNILVKVLMLTMILDTIMSDGNNLSLTSRKIPLINITCRLTIKVKTIHQVEALLIIFQQLLIITHCFNLLAIVLNGTTHLAFLTFKNIADLACALHTAHLSAEAPKQTSPS